MDVLDIHDDRGALLAVLGSRIPEAMKNASVAEPEDVANVPDDLFALVLERPRQSALRKFACTDGPTTFVSALYLTHTYRHLTPAAVKTAAKCLREAALVYGVDLPPELEGLEHSGGLTVLAADAAEAPVNEEKKGQLANLLEAVRERRQERKLQKKADLVGTEVMPVGLKPKVPESVKKLASVDNHVLLQGPTVEQLEPAPRDLDLGVKTAGAVYPLDKMRDLLDLEGAFQHGISKIAAEDRAMVASALVERERDLGVPSSAQALKYAGCCFRPRAELEAALWQRQAMAARSRKDSVEYGKLASVTAPLEYAEKLAAIDRALGFDREWDRALEDPWGATLAHEKEAAVIYNNKDVFVSDHQLEWLAKHEPKKVLCAILDGDMIEEFIKDPVRVFQSMPEPMKMAIGRLANDPLWRGDPR